MLNLYHFGRTDLVTLLRCSAFIAVCIVFGGCSSTSTSTFKTKSVEQPFSGPLPVTPRVTQGQLDNGLRYIIQKNAKPEKRVDLRLIVNIGSLAEDESQLGFAHFAEHMAFNGTEDFEKHQIVEFVESIGMKFGSHLNAHTSFDETVYKLHIPTDRPENVEKGFHILENWAHKIRFEPEEIDKERGVILEELRRRKGASDRIRQKQTPVTWAGARHIKRWPIGTKEIIEHGKHQDLIRFYREWYRPELMSIVVVGDVDPQHAEQLIHQYFSPLSSEQNLATKIRYSLPDNLAPLVSIETDPEITYSSVRFQIKHDKKAIETYEDLKQQLIRQLVIGMLNTRLLELTLSADSSAIKAHARFGLYLADKNQFTLSAQVKSGKSLEGLTQLVNEYQRVWQHGFLSSELKRQKKSLVGRVRSRAKEIDKTYSRVYLGQYAAHLLHGSPLLDAEQRLAAYRNLVKTIHLEEVNQLVKSFWRDDNQVISIVAPASDGESLPSVNQVLEVVNNRTSSSLGDYVDNASSSKLIKTLPSPGRVVEKSFDESLQAHIWQLSNGATVLLKRTDFKDNQVLFRAQSTGGTSMLSPEHYKQVSATPSVVRGMGLGDMSAVQLSKYVKGKSVSVKPRISTYQHGLTGNSSVKRFKDLLEFVHLAFQRPRHDQQMFDTMIEYSIESIRDRNNSPQYILNQHVQRAKYGNSLRYFERDEEYYREQTLQPILDFYQQQFSNAANFDFVFVGNIDLDKAQPLIETYIASIPSKEATDEWKVLPNDRNKGNLEVKVKKGLADKASVRLDFYGDRQWLLADNSSFSAMRSILSKKLREQLREEKSGVYTVKVRGGFSALSNQHSLSISFTCNPDRVDELIADTRDVLDSFKQQVPDIKYVDNYKKEYTKSMQARVKSNSFWLGYLTASREHTQPFIDMATRASSIDAISPEDIQRAAQVFISERDTFLSILLPEEGE
jgi:zinc protease